MTMPVRTCAEVRKLEKRAEEELGMPLILLMENAGRSISSELLNQGVDGSVVILCGKGNNGGDGMVIARHLDNQNVQVRVLLFAAEDDLAGDASINYQIAKKCGIEMHLFPEQDLDRRVIDGHLAGANWIVDALFGSGLKGGLRAPFDQLAQWVNETETRVMAVDVPSGLNADTGEVGSEAIRADSTVTLVAVKKGLLESKAKPWVGELHFRTAGLPRCLLRDV